MFWKSKKYVYLNEFCVKRTQISGFCIKIFISYHLVNIHIVFFAEIAIYFNLFSHKDKDDCFMLDVAVHLKKSPTILCCNYYFNIFISCINILL